jgi:O-antigen/teichoic acid export membrane protein
MTLARKVAATTASLVAGRMLTLLAGIGATALASRYLGLEGFGALTLGMAIVSLVALLTDLGMSTMAAREIAREPEREREIIGNVRSLGLAFSVGAALLLVGVAEVAYSGNGDVRRAILVLSLQLLTAPFVGAARAHFQASQRGPLIAIGDVALAVAMFGGSLIAYEADLGFTAMVGAVAAGYVAQALTMTALMPSALRLAWVARGDTWGLLLRISLPLGATMIVNYLYFRLDVVLLSILKGEDDVAVYGLAYRVLEGLMVLPAYFMLALFPEIARLTGQRERVDGIVNAALGVMEAIALPLVLVFAMFADDVIRVIAGDDFSDAAWVLRILTVALGVSYLSGVYGNALPALGRQNQLFRWSLVVLGANLVVNLALIPPFGVVGAAIAVVLSELIGFAVVRHLYGQVGRAPWPSFEPRMLLAGLLMAAAMAPLLLVPNGFAGSLVAVAVGGALGGLVYAAALIALRAVPAAVVPYLPARVLRLGRSA